MTDIVNATERQLQTNLGQWQAQQKSADDAVSRAWQLLDGMVATLRGYGAPGTKSAAERDRRIDPTQLRWDWIAYYIEPIVGAVTSPPPVPGGSVQPGTNGGTYTPPGYIPPMGFVIDPLMIGAALVLLLVLLRD